MWSRMKGRMRSRTGSSVGAISNLEFSIRVVAAPWGSLLHPARTNTPVNEIAIFRIVRIRRAYREPLVGPGRLADDGADLLERVRVRAARTP